MQNYNGPDSEISIYHIVRNNNVHEVKRLLDAGMSPEIQTKCMNLAVRKNRKDMVDLLIAHGVPVSSDELIWSCLNGHWDITEVLPKSKEAVATAIEELKVHQLDEQLRSMCIKGIRQLIDSRSEMDNEPCQKRMCK